VTVRNQLHILLSAPRNEHLTKRTAQKPGEADGVLDRRGSRKYRHLPCKNNNNNNNGPPNRERGKMRRWQAVVSPTFRSDVSRVSRWGAHTCAVLAMDTDALAAPSHVGDPCSHGLCERHAHIGYSHREHGLRDTAK